jgi:hypothetical protein
MNLKATFTVLCALGLSACASIVEGTSQAIMVNTNPSGADCTLNREGVAIARVSPTPGSVTIKKTKYDMSILCSKAGYQDTTFMLHSGEAGATYGNLAFGGLIGWGIDSATGADNKYDSPVNISLVPLQNVSTK